MSNNKGFVKNIIEFISYATVGASNVLIDILVFNLLWKITGHSIGNINYLFKLISFSIYSTTGYLLNKNMTFKSSGEKGAYFKYASLLAFLSFLDAALIVKLTRFNIFHIKHILWNNICVLFAAMATGLLGYIINKFFIFAKKQKGTELTLRQKPSMESIFLHNDTKENNELNILLTNEKINGKAEMLISQLEKKFNGLSTSDKKTILDLNEKKLDLIAVNIFEIRDTDELRKYF